MAERKKPVIDKPVIVEGKYDKITLSAVIDAHIIPVGGFALFNNREKTALIRRLGEKTGIIVLTDSDGGVRQIRAGVSMILPKEKIIHLYIPKVKGKEKRKDKPGKAGLLGVEGMDADTLYRLFLPFDTGKAARRTAPEERLTKADFYADGLSGGKDSAGKRGALASLYGLPSDMTANALLEAVNLLSNPREYREKINSLPVLFPQLFV
ncbi:MAG: DUF4093 domain-containing protein [Clostridia bacterium]|nr:DUF4093 domain-containing protein [Clostridia bacterium]